MSKDDAINIMKVLFCLIKEVFYKKKIVINVLLYIKMSENTDLTHYQKNRDVVLNKAKGYYENNKERLKMQGRDKYRNLSEEEKIKEENMEKIDIITCLKRRK